MSSHLYYGIKDAEYEFSFAEAKWLTSYEVVNQMRSLFTSICFDPNSLIYPNELIMSDSQIVDVLLLAKYRNKYGNLKLKSILLSQLINMVTLPTSTVNSLSMASKLLILKLPKSSYYWCKVDNANFLPKFALRVGYDQTTRQFSYIGRMKISSLLYTSGAAAAAAQTSNGTAISMPISLDTRRDLFDNDSSQSTFNLKNVTNTITNLIGTLSHIYEYIPAIVLQLHDLSYLDEKKLFNFGSGYIQDQPPVMNNAQTHQQPQQQQQQQLHHYQNHEYPNQNQNQNDSFWSKLRAAIKNKNSNDMDFNFISTNYEVLCLKKQPATLKQLCIIKLNKINDESLFEMQTNNTNKQKLELYKSLKSLPNSIRNLIWPSFLMPGQCIIKNGRMRSSNGSYELNITKQGTLRFIKIIKTSNFPDKYENENTTNLIKSSHYRQVTTFEKNVESLLVTQCGVFIIYDNNQAMRKPTLLYKNLNRQLASASSTSSSSAPSQLSSSSSLVNSSPQFIDNDEFSLIDDHAPSYYHNLLDNSLGSSFVLELSDNGYLRVIVQTFISSSSSYPNTYPSSSSSSSSSYQHNHHLNNKCYKSKPIVLNLFNLNEFFRSFSNPLTPTPQAPSSSSSSSPAISQTHQSSPVLNSRQDEQNLSKNTTSTSITATTTTTASIDVTNNTQNNSFYINVKLVFGDLKDLKNIPIKIMHFFMSMIRYLVQNIVIRRLPAQIS